MNYKKMLYIDMESLTGYYIEKSVIKDQKELDKFYHYITTINLYDYGVIDEYAMILLKRLSKTHELFIFTSFLVGDIFEKTGIFAKNKFDFLYKNFEFIDPSNFILGGNKSIVSAKYFVDDRLENLTGNSDIKILYTEYHNKLITDKELMEKGVFRISSMQELEKCIYGEYSLQEMQKIVNETLYNVLGVTNNCYSLDARLFEKNKKKIILHFRKQCFFDDDIKKTIKYFKNRLGFDDGEIICDS